MDAIKLLFILFCFPFLINAQKAKFPKDTIYILYEQKSSNIKKLNWKYKNKKGIYFSIKDINSKYISLFYPYEKLLDTLCVSKLKEYKTLNLKQIKKKHNNWIDRKFKNNKIKPYNGYFSSSFVTYLIEVISEEQFVIYPAIWRNEGVIN
jgi:hypothetical protein